MNFEDKVDGILNESMMKDPKKWKVAKDMGMTVKSWMVEAGVFENENFKDQVEDTLTEVLKFLKNNKGT